VFNASQFITLLCGFSSLISSRVISSHISGIVIKTILIK